MANMMRACLTLGALYFFHFFVTSQAACQSFGVDYVDGGGPYFVNTGSPDFFSFTNIFEGCDPSEGSITPILIDPDENEYFCSDIATTPPDIDQVSTCDVSGNVVLKSQMYSGDWIIIIEGFTFAWMRTFSIIAGLQMTVTLTPTATFNVTTTPSTTINTTTTCEYDTTANPITLTVPSATIVRTKTVTPSKVTVTSTTTSTKTETFYSFTATAVTKTKTATCKTQPPSKDPTCTIQLTKNPLLTNSTTTTSPKFRKRVVDKAVVHRRRQENGFERLEKRTLDVATTTTQETTFTVSVYSTFEAPTSTETDNFTVTTTQTITPPPTTVVSGINYTKITVTAPTPTRTMVTKTVITTYTTKTLIDTITIITTITPSGVVCTTN